MLAATTFGSFEFRYNIASLVHKITISSIKPLKGSCSALEVPYNVALLKFLGSPSHLRRQQLVVLSMASMIVIRESYTNNGHRILGSTVCWYIHTLKWPSWPDLSTLACHNSRLPTMAWTALVSLSVMLKIFPRIFMGHSNKVGIIVPAIGKLNLSTILPFFMMNDLNLVGLNFIFAHVISFSRLHRIHLM